MFFFSQLLCRWRASSQRHGKLFYRGDGSLSAEALEASLQRQWRPLYRGNGSNPIEAMEAILLRQWKQMYRGNGSNSTEACQRFYRGNGSNSTEAAGSLYRGTGSRSTEQRMHFCANHHKQTLNTALKQGKIRPTVQISNGVSVRRHRTPLYRATETFLQRFCRGELGQNPAFCAKHHKRTLKTAIKQRKNDQKSKSPILPRRSPI